jgi:hypothetical protein
MAPAATHFDSETFFTKLGLRFQSARAKTGAILYPWWSAGMLPLPARRALELLILVPDAELRQPALMQWERNRATNGSFSALGRRGTNAPEGMDPAAGSLRC